VEENPPYGRRVVATSFLRDLLIGRRTVSAPPAEYLDHTIEWLCRAQDATPDGGVARQFNLRRGWLPSYPETTGYIIPTFFRYAELRGERNYGARAERMAAWLLGERLADGSTYGGGVEAEVKSPAIFNTGMVQFGFLRAYESTGDQEYLDAIREAALFLVASQDPDGAWRRNLSRYATGKVHVYNTRTAWALALSGQKLHEPGWIDAAVKNVEWALEQSNENGWLRYNDLVSDASPLTHTIAYAFRGILETAVIVGRQDWIDGVRRVAETLIERQDRDGSLAGCLDGNWNPTVRSVCLTGCAQIALIWLRLFEMTHEARFLQAAQIANRYVMSTQILDHSNPGIRGGVKGSQPIWGDYLDFCYPNWAAKFAADAVMLELRVAEPRSARTAVPFA